MANVVLVAAATCTAFVDVVVVVAIMTMLHWLLFVLLPHPFLIMLLWNLRWCLYCSANDVAIIGYAIANAAATHNVPLLMVQILLLILLLMLGC